MSALIAPTGTEPFSSATATAESTIDATAASAGYAAAPPTTSGTSEPETLASDFVSVSTEMSSFPRFVPYEPAWITGRSCPSGPATSQEYAWCVWADTMASICADAPRIRSPNPDASAVTSAQSSDAEPLWVRSTITSAAPASVSSPATRFAASSWSPNVTSAMPVGVTMVAVSAVTVPMKATRTPSTSSIAYSSSAGAPVSLS